MPLPRHLALDDYRPGVQRASRKALLRLDADSADQILSICTYVSKFTRVHLLETTSLCTYRQDQLVAPRHDSLAKHAPELEA